MKINEFNQKNKFRIISITKNGSLLKQVVKKLQEQGINAELVKRSSFKGI
ncbi:hypothetical protein [Priestia megaterium]